MPDAPRIFSAAAGRLGRTPPSDIAMLEAAISPEELAKRRAELHKRELIAAGRAGFDITRPDDFDRETFAPWWVRLDDQTIWRAESGSPPGGYLPATHCVLIHDDGSWGYLTSAAATGAKAPRSVAELRERQEARARKDAEREEERAAEFKRRQAAAVPVTVASLDRHDPPTLRDAVETIDKAAGKVEVRGGRVVVSLPPGEVTVGPYGEKAGSRAARVCYASEPELIAIRRGDGRIAAEKVPAEPVLPSGRLAPS